MTHLPGFGFDITHRDPQSRARVGTLQTPHGTIETPNFIFCGTKANMKTVLPDDLRRLGVDIILANTYHLMIQPGSELVEQQGGLHKFMDWRGPMLTDSGGFQVFSMGHGAVADEIKGKQREGRNKTLLKVTEEGAAFRSYVDGRKIMLTPEDSMRIQRELGADLIVMFDECTAFHDSKDYTAASMRRSHRWGDRCLTKLAQYEDGKQGLYSVVQGGVYEDLRIESSQYTASRDFFGTAIGGCLGDTQDKMMEIVSWCRPHLPDARPIHFLGVGGITDIIRGVAYGLDTFDCVSPTRLARHGWALAPRTPSGRLNIRNACYMNDSAPLDNTLDNVTSRNFSRAYIHHLFRAKEMLGMQILSLHNIAVMVRLMKEIRAAIKDGTFQEYAASYGCKI